MLARLGNVLYWLGNAGAALSIAGVIALFYLAERMPDADKWLFATIAAVFAVMIWLIGRAAKYVLSGN